MSLYIHKKHEHVPQNINDLHAYEHDHAGINQRIAIRMTAIFSDMRMFWLIIIWIASWIAVNATIARFDPLPWPLLLALASVPQLPLMIVIMVGQNVLSRKQELQADEQFDTTKHMFHDIGQIMLHLDAQDKELIKQSTLIVQLLETKQHE